MRTGSGESGEVNTSGIEGIGSTPTLLMLSDSDDTGLDVIAKALLVASAPGTAVNNLYADADRGGTDTPLDGELGIGPDNTLMSRFRRNATTALTINDNDNPVALDTGTYFEAGGDGNDLTLYLQTQTYGEVSLAVVDFLLASGGHFVRFTCRKRLKTY